MTGAVIPPIYATSTYKQDGVGGMRGGYEYSRSANPTRTALEGIIAALEQGERGFAFASGLAAEDTLLRALCRPGDHVVIPDDAYGGTYRLFDKVEQAWGLAHSPAAVSDVDAVRAAIRPGETKLVWVETPTNPLLNIGDIETLASVAHDAGRAAGRRQHLRLAVPPAAADPRRRHRRALHHEVLRRPLRRRRRRARRQGPRRGREGRLPPELHRRGRRAVRRVPHAPRAQDPRRADGPALRQRGEGRRVPVRPRQGRRGDLPRARVAPRPRGRGEADEALRRHRVVPGHRRRAARARRVRQGRGLHARGVARRRRVADRAPRPDDPRVRRGHRPRGPRRT